FLQAGAPSPRDHDGSVLLALRPEKISVGHAPTNLENSVDGHIADFKYFGSSFYLQVATKLFGRIMVKTPAARAGFQTKIEGEVGLGGARDARGVVRAS